MSSVFENEVINAIKERRSVRSFLSTQVEEEKIKLLLEAAIFAPSAVNGQPWFFTVVQNLDILNKMNQEIRNIMLQSSDENLKKFASKEDFNVFHNAPMAIIVQEKKIVNLPRLTVQLQPKTSFLLQNLSVWQRAG